MAGHLQNNSESKRKVESIEERYSFARKELRLQKVLVVVLFCFILVGLLGLFGDGYFSERTISAENYEIEYQQFVREETPTELTIHLKKVSENISVSFNDDYVRQVRIEQVLPEPENMWIEDNRLFYSFGSSSEGSVIFYLNPERSGAKTLSLSVQDELHQLTQYVYF